MPVVRNLTRVAVLCPESCGERLGHRRRGVLTPRIWLATVVACVFAWLGNPEARTADITVLTTQQ